VLISDVQMKDRKKLFDMSILPRVVRLGNVVPTLKQKECARMTTNKLVLGLLAMLVASVTAVPTELADKSGTQETRATNGLKMYYEIHGAGKPLVLLHGAFGWATVHPTLAKNRQVIERLLPTIAAFLDVSMTKAK